MGQLLSVMLVVVVEGSRCFAQLISHHLYPRAAHIPLFLYPFLNTVSKTRPFEYLRLTSLGVIGALVKVGHLLISLTLPRCLRPRRASSFVFRITPESALAAGMSGCSPDPLYVVACVCAELFNCPLCSPKSLVAAGMSEVL